MRYRENAQDTWHRIKVKALDSMPVGTIVDFDGQASDIPTGWEQVNDYSTDEIDTGKTWIDGKKIYRKVVSDTNIADGTTIISNVDTIISIIGMGDCGTGALRQLPYYEWYNNSKYACRLEKLSTNLNLDSQLGGSPHTAKLHVTIEYTKAS